MTLMPNIVSIADQNYEKLKIHRRDAVFDPESFDPESFDPELMTEGLMTEGLRPKGVRRGKGLFIK